MPKRLVVIDEHTLGCIDPRQPDYAQILHASVLRGAINTDLDGTIIITFKTVRPATKADFELYRVSVDGYWDDPAYAMDRS